MEYSKFIEDIKEAVPLKETISINDIIIFVIKQYVVYGMVTEIVKDTAKLGDWWHVSFILFGIPNSKSTIILITPQMTGKEIFTINGE